MIRDEAIHLETEKQGETAQTTGHIRVQEAASTQSLQEQVAVLSNTLAQLTMTVIEL